VGRRSHAAAATIVAAEIVSHTFPALGFNQRIASLKNCFVRSAPSTAPRELTVDDHTRHAFNPVLLCPHCDVCLMHVVNCDVVGRARYTLDQVHRLVTRGATRGENLDLSSMTVGHWSILLLESPLKPRAKACMLSRKTGYGSKVTAGAMAKP
jgi:hypothetical protein